MKALFDTNILIDYLNGIANAKEEIEGYDKRLISSITWIEVMVGAAPEETETIRSFLNQFTLIPLDKKVSDLSVLIRKKYRIKLPDAIVWASAKASDAILITRNTKDFIETEKDIRVPYKAQIY